MADGPVFLERQSYRRRRLMDAVRLLPLLGLALWMIPLMWPFPGESGAGHEGGGIPMSTALRYLFGVWLGLVLTGWFLWRKTRQPDPQVSRPPKMSPE